MIDTLLIQLPIPQLNYGRQTGNIPLAAACLKQAATVLPDSAVEILPESIVSYLADAALIRLIASRRPEIIGFTVYSWNVRRSQYLAEMIKKIYRPLIIFGGPEITPDNEIIHSQNVDAYICGEGEAVFRRLLQSQRPWDRFIAGDESTAIFETSPSPYTGGLLEPWVENLMLLETQRGCPYRCAYCFYNKSREQISSKSKTQVLDAVRWACGQRTTELFLLDPSLNSRAGLKGLLKQIGGINANRSTALLGEIRAESLNTELADLFASAGFIWFETGLQSTNPSALMIMNRRTDLKKFLTGVHLLKQRGIIAGIDLIAGLPGDDLDGFKHSVDFVVENGLQDDVQVFPLAVLPGTEFRRKSRALGLHYEPEPPYPVMSTPTFSEQEMLMAFDYAESRLDVCLYPLPDLDAAWRFGRQTRFESCRDITVLLGKNQYVCKLVVADPRPLSEFTKIAERLTHPYQIIIGPNVHEQQYITRMLAILTEANPFTALELVFLEPIERPDTGALLEAVCLQRPQYLDHDQRYLFPATGNRSVLFTLISRDASPRFTGDMQRQVFWWQHDRLPAPTDLLSLSGLDGMLVDPPMPAQQIAAWQHHISRYADEYLHIGFADLELQKRWMQLTAANDYYFGALKFGVRIG